ncbi:MAG: hypothetical protein IJP29_04755 [Lachnospiraceae bacterium]|nr:hypothetical protein [Lachnospiraceae bacterium]
MEKEIIKNSLDQLNPTEEQSKMMWERLQKAMAEKNEQQVNDAPADNVVAFEKTETIGNETEDAINEEVTEKAEETQAQAVVEAEQETSNVVSINSRRKNKVLKRAMAVAAAIALIIVGTIGANVATDGAVYAAIMKWLKFDQGRQDVVGNMVDSQNRFNTVWAPDIYYLDGDVMVFGGLRGTIVYDLTNNQVSATIDTQKIDCVYFDSKVKQTHILKDEDCIVVFNSENGVPSGSYYIYDLKMCNSQELEVSETGDDETLLNQYYEQWNVLQNQYIDTFETFRDYKEVESLFSIDYDDKYSVESISWENADKIPYYSFLAIQDKQYVLYHFDIEKEEFSSVKLDLSQAIVFEENSTEASLGEVSENGTIVLKQFVYYGDSEAIEAICKYMEEDYLQYSVEDKVWIPGYVIHKEVEKDGEYLVFGNFWSYGYQLTGTILESQSGTEMPACFHLKETENGYEVVSVDTAGDGSYVEDIQAFTADYPGLYDLFMEYDEEKRMDAQKEYVQMYVKGHNLSIEYYKEYGWDPVKIFE